MTPGFTIALRVPFLAIALLALALLASARAAEEVTLGGIAFPPEVDGASRGEVRDFESRVAGLGHGVRYDKRGWTVDVFVYDLKQSAISDDLEGAQLRGQLEQAKRDVIRAERERSGIEVAEKRSFRVSATSGAPRLTCAAFALPLQKEPERLDSSVCLGSLRNKFVKFRVTTRVRETSGTETETLLRAFVDRLWGG